jgi:large subunit ribosomal protein L10
LLQVEDFHPKAVQVDELLRLIEKNEVIANAELFKVRSNQLQQLRRKFRSDVHMQVVKNNIIKRALIASKKHNIENLIDSVSGSSIFLFTSINPFKLNLILENSTVNASAKAGDIAQGDIVIPRGNTGLPPGPAISELHEIGIRTRIETGSIWVMRETVVVKEGDVISPSLASVLSKLGMKPIEVGLHIQNCYYDGFVLNSDQLRLDLEETRNEFKTAFNQAFNFAVEAQYPTVETLPTILSKAITNARNLAFQASYPAKEVVGDLMRKGYQHMLSLSAKLKTKDEKSVSSTLT